MRNWVVGGIGIGVFMVAWLFLEQTSIADELVAGPELMLETLLSAQLDGVEGAELLVFRVHEHGEPERILVD